MGFFVLILIVAVIWLLSEVSGLKAALSRLDDKQLSLKSELQQALARLQRLESGIQGTTSGRGSP